MGLLKVRRLAVDLGWPPYRQHKITVMASVPKRSVRVYFQVVEFQQS